LVVYQPIARRISALPTVYETLEPNKDLSTQEEAVGPELSCISPLNPQRCAELFGSLHLALLRLSGFKPSIQLVCLFLRSPQF